MRSRTLMGGVFLIKWGVFRSIVAFSGVSLVSAGPEVTDFKLGGCPTSAWQNSRQRGSLPKCGSYLKGGSKAHAGCKVVSDGANSSLMIVRLVVTTAPGCC